jgi:uncharacterized repeat protein (TIGR03803 family)
LYGTADSGGIGGNGTIFAVNTDGTGFTNLHSFTAAIPNGINSGGAYPGVTNSDGAYPLAGLILSGGTLYGTASQGGSSGGGTVFAVNTDGTGFTNLHAFTPLSNGYFGTNNEGGYPLAGLVLSSGTLYGATSRGGTSGKGVVFAVNTNGTGFATLHSFTANNSDTGLNTDGGGPDASLILSGKTLYGTSLGGDCTASGGSFGQDAVFAVNIDGSGYTNLHSFPRSCARYYDPTYTNTDGADVNGLILSGSTLYGTTSNGGSPGSGSVFSLTLPPPQLTIIPSAGNILLTWPTNATSLTLQSTTNLGSSAIWTTNSAAPVVVNGQNTVTNPISGTQQFFRLSQ